MPRDSEILRDLIFMWDPENLLAKGSQQRTEANEAMVQEAAAKRAKQLDAAKEIRDRHVRLRLPVPSKVRHFLHEGEGRNAAEAPRRFYRGIIGL